MAKVTTGVKSTATFSCHQCGQCCWGRGGVRLTPAEAKDVARYLKTPGNFAELYLEPEPKPNDIRVGFDGFCIFHRPTGQCLIHPVKPEVCRTWPFLPSLLNHEQAFIDAQGACPALAEFSSWNDFLRYYSLKTIPPTPS